jgi:hypothetical protein
MDSQELAYEPVQSNFYNYSAKQFLIRDIDDYLESNTFNEIKIVAYEVNNDGVSPFLQFLLFKDDFLPYLSLPFIPLNYNNATSEQIINMAKIVFIGLNLTDNYESFAKNIVFDGFYEHNGEMFLFVDITKNKLNLYDIYSDSVVRLALVDEILNQKHVCNIPVDKTITDFFIQNYEYCVLKDNNNEDYEIPVVSYVGKPVNKLNFTYTFGETKQNKNAILGPHYYFTSFENAFKEGMINNDNKYGVVRFAVFTKKIKYIENFVDDNIDESETKKMKLQDETVDQQYERLTMRITDYDGKWAENYDSCYLGYIDLDNGEQLKNTPILVVKEYNQQIPLSYHYNKKPLVENDYSIV